MPKPNAGITMNGLAFLEGILERMSDVLKTEVDLEMKVAADTIAYEAAIAAGAIDDGGRIRSAIRANTNTPFKKFITVNAQEAAYNEFGTGEFAKRYVPTLPDEIQRYAKTFYINGKGTTPEQPYIMPAAIKEFAEVVKRIEKLLETEFPR